MWGRMYIERRASPPRPTVGKLSCRRRQLGVGRENTGEPRPTTELRGAREVLAPFAQPIADGVDEVERQVAGDELKVVSRRPHVAEC